MNTALRLTAPVQPFSLVLDPAVQAGKLRPYVKEDSPDAALLRGMLAGAGISTEGRPLSSAVTEFQTKFNAGAASPIGVDGKAGSETLGALSAHLEKLGRTDLAVGRDGNERFAAFQGRGVDYSAAQARQLRPDALSGADLGTLLQASRNNPAAVRQMLDAKLRDNGSDEGGGGGVLAMAAKRGVAATGDAPVKLAVTPKTNMFELAVNEANRTGRAQTWNHNGADVTVRPGETMEGAFQKHVDTQNKARAAQGLAPKGVADAFEARPGTDAFEDAAAEAKRTGRGQTWKHNGVDVTVRPGETGEAAFQKYCDGLDKVRAEQGLPPKQRATAFQPQVGTDAFEGAAREAKLTGHAQTWKHNGVTATVRPSETGASAFARFKAEAGGGVAKTAAEAAPALGNGASAAARVLGKVAVPVGLALDAFDIGSAVKRDADRADGANTEATRAVGRAAGGWGGAAAGAAAGTFLIPIPVVGTVIGALIGGLGGSALGESIAESL